MRSLSTEYMKSSVDVQGVGVSSCEADGCIYKVIEGAGEATISLDEGISELLKVRRVQRTPI